MSKHEETCRLYAVYWGTSDRKLMGYIIDGKFTMLRDINGLVRAKLKVMRECGSPREKRVI